MLMQARKNNANNIRLDLCCEKKKKKKGRQDIKTTHHKTAGGSYQTANMTDYRYSSTVRRVACKEFIQTKMHTLVCVTWRYLCVFVCVCVCLCVCSAAAEYEKGLLQSCMTDSHTQVCCDSCSASAGYF